MRTPVALTLALLLGCGSTAGTSPTQPAPPATRTTPSIPGATATLTDADAATAHVGADESPQQLVAAGCAAESAGDQVLARRRYDQARVAFERLTQTVPVLTFLAAAPLPADEMNGLANSTVVAWPGHDLEGRRGFAFGIKGESASPDRWFEADRFRALGDDRVMIYGRPAANTRVVALRTGVERLGPVSGEARLSPSGHQIAWLSNPPVVLRSADLAVLSVIQTGAFPDSARWLDDDRLLFTRVHDDQDMTLYIADLAHDKVLEEHGQPALLSPNATYLASYSPTSGGTPGQIGQGRLRVRDLGADAIVVDAAVAHRCIGWALAFSPDEKRLVFLPDDGTAEVISLPTGRRYRVGRPSAVGELPKVELVRAVMGESGFVCTYVGRGFDSCEPEIRFEVVHGAVPAAPAGTRFSCFERPGGAAEVLLVPTRAVTSPARTILPSAIVHGADHCNRALSGDGRRLAWFESVLSGAERPQERSRTPGGRELEDLVLVIADASTRHPVHALEFTAPRSVVNGLTLSLTFTEGDRVLEATVGAATTRINVDTGRRLPTPPPSHTAASFDVASQSTRVCRFGTLLAPAPVCAKHSSGAGGMAE